MKKLLLIMLTGAGALSAQESGDSWLTLQDSGYTIQYPAEWRVNQSGFSGTSFGLFSPLERPDDDFSENVNLLIQNLEGMGMDLDSYTAISEEQIPMAFLNAKILYSERVKSPTGAYHSIAYSGSQQNYHLIFRQYFWVLGDRAFVLTFTAEEESWEQFETVAKTIMDSFRIKFE